MKIEQYKESIIELLNEQNRFLKEIGKSKEHYSTTEYRERINIYDKDYARVLYSSSYRRLQGKMQLFPENKNSTYRNRLTHSYEVQQIAKSIVNIIRDNVGDEYFSLDETVVVQLGALAHDIGNPPFGHSGERKLNSLMKDYGGYEGNAQTVRVLRHLERKSPEYNGLNLTFRSLLSVVKYFKKYDEGKNKKFIYNEDYDFINNVICPSSSLKPRTIDVQIVDLADEIAYCTHDLEDALRNNYFTINDLIFNLNKKIHKSELNKFISYVEKAKEFAESNRTKSIEDYSHFFRKELTSILVESFIKDIGVVENSDAHVQETGTYKTRELGFVELENLIINLKKSIFDGVTRTPEIIQYEKKGDLIIESLFKFFKDESNINLLPPEFRYEKAVADSSGTIDKIKEIEKNRKICDYISGMMDSYAIDLYEKLKREGLLK